LQKIGAPFQSGVQQDAWLVWVGDDFHYDTVAPVVVGIDDAHAKALVI
jgi:hypothetical protein